MEKLQEILKYTKDLVNQEPEKSAFWHYNKLVSKIEEAIERQEQLSLCSVVDSSVTISKQEYDALIRDSDNLRQVDFSM